MIKKCNTCVSYHECKHIFEDKNLNVDMDFHSCNKYERVPYGPGKFNRVKMRFIGKDGSMGLKHGSEYWVKIYNNHKYIFVEWESNRCPYSSLIAVTWNWESV